MMINCHRCVVSTRLGGINRSAHVPEKQTIFRLVFNISAFCVATMLVFGTASSLMLGGGVIAAGILNVFLAVAR
jgi:hypothetical protein